jgi:hypothetical protein
LHGTNSSLYPERITMHAPRSRQYVARYQLIPHRRESAIRRWTGLDHAYARDAQQTGQRFSTPVIHPCTSPATTRCNSTSTRPRCAQSEANIRPNATMQTAHRPTAGTKYVDVNRHRRHQNDVRQSIRGAAADLIHGPCMQKLTAYIHSCYCNLPFIHHAFACRFYCML